ncbi:MAG: hypothetical protein HY678_03890 [Chloroflexi bacterium]|nr:hypothetical protein [Chloroflexota bacterium]
MAPRVIVTDTSTLLLRQTRFSWVREFDYTMSPYSGCAFQCGGGLGDGRVYCYVPDLQYGRAERLGGWGNYVEVRARAADVLRRHGDRLAGATVFMSATTDPYQPAERRYGITRRLLETLVGEGIRFRWLLVSTRSPLVLRDIDLYQQLRGRVEIGISLPSDREDVRRALDPRNPPVRARLEALMALRRAGIPVRLQVSPVLPHSESYPQTAAEAADWVWMDWLQHRRVGGGALNALGWGDYLRKEFVLALTESWRHALGDHRVGLGREWFAARWDGTRAARWLSREDSVSVGRAPSGRK